MPTALQPATPDFAAARFHMVECQVRPNKVRDQRILDAMGGLPREMFVAPSMAGIAYMDKEIEVSPGRYLLEPMVLARMIEEAHVTSGDRVLDLAPATGYSTALLASIAAHVVGVEGDVVLYNLASANLASLSVANAKIENYAPQDGWKQGAPYDVIIVNGGVDLVPTTVCDQLADGGRLIAVVRKNGPSHAAHTGEARLYEKIHGMFSYRVVFNANVKLLPGFRQEKTFLF